MVRTSTSDGGSLGRHGGGRRRRGRVALALTLALLVTSVATASATPNLELDPDPGDEPRLDVDYLDADAPSGPRVLVDGVPLDADYTGFAHWGAALPFFESRRVLRTDGDRLTVAVEVPDDDPDAYDVSLSVLYSVPETFDDGEGGTFEFYDNRTASSAELVALFWDEGAACDSMGVVDRTFFPGFGGEDSVTPIPELPGFAIPARDALDFYNGGRPTSMLVASSEVTSAAPLVCTLRTIPGTTISVTVEIGQAAPVHAAVAEELPRQLSANATAFAETEGGPLVTFDGVEAHPAFQEVQAWIDTLPEECELERDSSRLALLAWVADAFDPASAPEDPDVPSAAAVAELAGLLGCPGDLADVAADLSALWYGGRAESLSNDFQDAVFGTGCSLADDGVRSTDLLAWVVGSPYPDPPTPEWTAALEAFVTCGPEAVIADAVDALDTLWVGAGGARERLDAALAESDDCTLDTGIDYADVASWLEGEGGQTAAELFECVGGTGSELEDAAGVRVSTLWYGVASGYRSVLDGGVFGAGCDYAPAAGPADLARLAIFGPFDGDALDVFIDCTDPGPTTLDDLAVELAAAWSGEGGAQDELDALLAEGSCEYLDGAAVPELVDWVDDDERTTEGLALLLACTAGERALARSLLFDLQGPLLVDEGGSEPSPLPLFPAIGNWLAGAVGFSLGPDRGVCSFDLPEDPTGGDAGAALADLLEAVQAWRDTGGAADLEGILDCPDGRVDIDDPDGRAVAFLISATDPDLADSRVLPDAGDADGDGRIGDLHWFVAREVARGASYDFGSARDDWRDAVGPGFGSGIRLEAAAACADEADLGPCLVSVGGGDGPDGADGIEDGWAVILNDRSFALADVSIGDLLGMAARLTLVRTDPRGADGLGVVEGDRVRVHLRLPAQGPADQDWAGVLRPFTQTTGEVLGHAVTSVADGQAVELDMTLSARERSAAFDYPSGEDLCTVGVEAGPDGPAAEATDCDLPDAAAEIVEVRLRSSAFFAGHDPAGSGTAGVRSTRRLTEWGIDPLRDAAERGVEDCDSGRILANVPDPVCVEDGLHVMLFTEGDAPVGDRAVVAGDELRVGGLVDLADLATGLGLGSVPAEWGTFDGRPLEVVADGGFLIAVRIPDELAAGVEAVHEACSEAGVSPYASEGFFDVPTPLCLPSAWSVDEFDARAYDPGAVVVLRTAGPHGFTPPDDPGSCPEGTVPVVVSQLGQQFDGSRCATLPDGSNGLEDDEIALQIPLLNVDEAFRQDRAGVVVLGEASTYVLSDTSIVVDLFGIDPDEVGPLDARSDAALALAGGFVATNGQGFDFGADLLEAEVFDFALGGPSVDEDFVSREDDGFFQVFLPAPYLGLLAEAAGVEPAEAAAAMGVERRDDATKTTGEVTAAVTDPGEYGLDDVDGAGVLIGSEGFEYSTPYFSIAPASGLTITTSSLGVLTRGQRVRLPLVADLAEGRTRWAVVEGALPPGMRLSTRGLLTGRPRSTGSGSVTIRVSDAVDSAERTFAWSVAEPLRIVSGRLPDGVVGLERSIDLEAEGGAGERTWTVVRGLPEALELDGATGTLEGAPAVTGRFRPVVRVTDAEGRTAERRLDLRVFATGVTPGAVEVTVERGLVFGLVRATALVEVVDVVSGEPVGSVEVR
ncbi:MAG: hypothetical protein RLZZ272_117, partial [Actinomycetota bacterium]